MSKIYCDTIQGINQESFNGVKLFHGFNAFFVSKSYRTCFNTILKQPNIQLCTSTKYIGYIGVTIEGHILTASNIDLFSGIDTEDNNRRYFDEKNMKNLVYDYKDLELQEDDNEENNEIITTNNKITGVWITSDAPNKLKEFAIELAKEHNLPLIQVGESIFA